MTAARRAAQNKKIVALIRKLARVQLQIAKKNAEIAAIKK